MATVSRPTKEEQDRYFRETVLDPWGANTPWVLDRQSNSLRFIQKFVETDFCGTFVEIGAFDGAFTRKIAGAFPSCRIIASDISRVAWENAALTTPLPASVTFDWSDIINFQLPAGFAESQSILLLMECLYYLPPDEQAAALKQLLERIPNATTIFISGPVAGGEQYFDEGRLREILEPNGMKFVDAHALNTKGAFRDLYSWDGDRLVRLFTAALFIWKRGAYKLLGLRGERLRKLKGAALTRLDHDAEYRRTYAHQVIYCFKKSP